MKETKRENDFHFCRCRNGRKSFFLLESFYFLCTQQADKYRGDWEWILLFAFFLSILHVFVVKRGRKMDNWKKGDRWRESYSHAYRGYPVRVKVRKIYDKYGMFSILIYRMAKRLCTVMHSSCVCLGWTGGKKLWFIAKREKTDCFYPHDVNSCE